MRIELIEVFSHLDTHQRLSNPRIASALTCVSTAGAVAKVNVTLFLLRVTVRPGVLLETESGKRLGRRALKPIPPTLFVTETKTAFKSQTKTLVVPSPTR